MNSNRKQPPIGGALLEAMFAYSTLDLANMITIARSMETSNCHPCKHEKWIARTANFDFIKPPKPKNIEQFLEWAIDQQIEDANLSYSAKLYDQIVNLSLSFDFAFSVVSMATTEDFLWGFTEDANNADFRRLDAFYHLCEAVCLARIPTRAIIGSETCHVDEISVSTATDRFQFWHDLFFCSSERQSLFDWYVTIYARRWDRTRT